MLFTKEFLFGGLLLPRSSATLPEDDVFHIIFGFWAFCAATALDIGSKVAPPQTRQDRRPDKNP